MASLNSSDPPLPSSPPLSLGERLVGIRDGVVDWIWAPVSPDTNRLLTFLQGLLRIHFIVFREIGRDRITLRASALTYTIVLSLVPTLALGTAVLKGLGAGDEMRQAAYRFIDQIDTSLPAPGASESDSGTMTPPGEATGQPATTPGAEGQKTGGQPAAGSMSAHLRRAVDQIFNYVQKTNFTTLGTFGIVGLVLAVLAVLGSIEKAMNTIWQADSGRPFGRKLMDYLALMILLPISVNLALATETTLQSPALMTRLQESLPIAWLGAFLLKMLPLLAVIATFSILYRFIPNTRVRFLPAFIGGFFGGVGWFLVQMVYIKMQIGVARYNAIYGSFATLPLLLIWIYAGWVVFLAGAEMAFAAQVWRRYNWYEIAPTPVVRLTVAFDIVSVALADFHHRLATYPTSVARRLRQPLPLIMQVMQDLVAGGIMRRVNGEVESYAPVATEEEIEPAEIVDLVFGKDIPVQHNSTLAIEVMQAARNSLTGKKIEWQPSVHEPRAE
jgi:membrane protein